MPAAVVSDRGLDVFRNGCEIVRQQFLDALVCEIRCRFKRLVQVRDIGVVVLPMMNLHRRLSMCGSSASEGVGKWWQCKWHWFVVSDLILRLAPEGITL